MHVILIESVDEANEASVTDGRGWWVAKMKARSLLRYVFCCKLYFTSYWKLLNRYLLTQAIIYGFPSPIVVDDELGQGGIFLAKYSRLPIVFTTLHNTPPLNRKRKPKFKRWLFSWAINLLRLSSIYIPQYLGSRRSISSFRLSSQILAPVNGKINSPIRSSIYD